MIETEQRQQTQSADRAGDHASAEATDSRSGQNGREQEDAHIPLWEWIVAAIGAILLLGSLGFMGYKALAGDESPPDLAVQVDAIVPSGNGYLVTFRALNQGGSAATSVVVEGSLIGATGIVETNEAIVDYLPPDSERTGGLLFASNPADFQLWLRAKGYRDP